MSDIIPPPPPARGGDSCWKWGAITCAIGCGALAILGIVLVVVLGPTFKGFFESAQRWGQQAQQCEKEMQRVWAAVEKFHQEKGRYPEKLESLLPNYLPNKSYLHFSGKPDGPPFTYHKPDPDAPPSTIVLEYHGLSMTVPGRPPVPTPLRLRKDGTLDPSSFQFRPPRERRPDFSIPPPASGNR